MNAKEQPAAHRSRTRTQAASRQTVFSVARADGRVVWVTVPKK